MTTMLVTSDSTMKTKPEVLDSSHQHLEDVLNKQLLTDHRSRFTAIFKASVYINIIECCVFTLDFCLWL